MKNGSTKLPALYELATEYQDALMTLTDMDDEAVIDTLEGLKGELEVKAVNVAMYCGNITATITAMKDAEKRIADRRKAYENKVININKYLKKNMENAGIHKIETPEMKLAIQKNPTRVNINDETAVPEEFWNERTTIVLDKKLLKAALEKDEVSGCELVQETRLVIK